MKNLEDIEGFNLSEGQEWLHLSFGNYVLLESQRNNLKTVHFRNKISNRSQNQHGVKW